MTRTGLTWRQVAMMVNLFYDKDLRDGQNITFPHVTKDAVGIFWSNDYTQHRSPLEYTGHAPVFSTGCVYAGSHLEYFRKTVAWHFMAEGQLTEVTASDFPEKGEDCTRITAFRLQDGSWSMMLEAGPDANPKYREAFDLLKQPCAA